MAERNKIAAERYDAILTEVKKDAQKDTLITLGDYYYYDETKKEIWDESNKIYYGYVKLADNIYNSIENKIETNEIQKYTNSEGKEISYTSDEAKLMATVEDVELSFEYTYNLWKSKVAELIGDPTKSIDDVIGKTVEDGKYEELRYVLETAQNMKLLGVSDTEIYNKIASLAFVELEWVYSGDSLGNEISNKIGYIVSSQEDNNMNWVVDFAVGARKIIADMKDPASVYSTLSSDKQAIYTEAVLTDYGYHIMKIENVYDKENSSIIDLSTISAEFELADDSQYVKELTKLLKKTYTCNGSNQTLYDYYYDEVYNALIGTSSSAGTYFLNIEYEWLSQYFKDGEIDIMQKVDYHELLETIS